MRNAVLSSCAEFIGIALLLGEFGCSNVTTPPGDNTNENSSVDGNDNADTDANSNDNTTSDTDVNDNGTTDTNANDNGTIDTNANENGAIDDNINDDGVTDKADSCGNDIGNGDEVIPGPSEPERLIATRFFDR